tara:strand:- start:87 stop:233 length:147 start_codon:yes stop_codon:yes gene_type:complete
MNNLMNPEDKRELGADQSNSGQKQTIYSKCVNLNDEYCYDETPELDQN